MLLHKWNLYSLSPRSFAIFFFPFSNLESIQFTSTNLYNRSNGVIITIVNNNHNHHYHHSLCKCAFGTNSPISDWSSGTTASSLVPHYKILIRNTWFLQFNIHWTIELSVSQHKIYIIYYIFTCIESYHESCECAVYSLKFVEHEYRNEYLEMPIMDTNKGYSASFVYGLLGCCHSLQGIISSSNDTCMSNIAQIPCLGRWPYAHYTYMVHIYAGYIYLGFTTSTTQQQIQ